MKFNCIEAKEDAEKKLAFQCFNCQQWNNHKTFECKNETKCVICAGAHRKSSCPKQKSDAKCSNCDGAHAAWSTECPTYKAAIETKKSYAGAAAESTKTPSFVKEMIQPIIFNAVEALKKQLAVMIAEVVAHAFLEHLYYEGEAKKTNGAKYLGTTARVNSIAKVAAQSVSSCTLHESDKSTVDVNEVQSALYDRLKVSMNFTKAPNTQNTKNDTLTQS